MKFTRRHLLLGTAAVLAGAGGAWWRNMARGYSGPVSDHFDGTHFTGRYASAEKTTLDFWRWRLTRQQAQWPQLAPDLPRDRPPPRVEQGMRVAAIGHSSLLIQAAGTNILIDPVFSERASPVTFAGPKRYCPPGIAFDDLPKIDAVLVTHGHYDHLDVATLSRLAKRDQPRMITPLGNDLAINGYDAAIGARAYDWHDRVVINDKIAVTLVPMRHWTARSLFDRNKALWAGFVIETPAGKILHMTDTGYGDGSQFTEARDRYGPFKLALIPIGAYEPRWFMRDQHINPAEAVRAFIDCGADRAVGHHFGMFQLTDEAIDAPLTALGDALKAANIAAERFVALKPGEVLTV